MQLFKYQFQPTRIITPSRGNELFIEGLEVRTQQPRTVNVRA